MLTGYPTVRYAVGGNLGAALGLPAPLPLIGISGAKGCGKDTVAAHLVRRYGYRQRAFADALKDQVIQLFKGNTQGKGVVQMRDFIEAHKHDPITSQHGWVRQLLQAWGMMRRDFFGEEYWIDQIRDYLLPGYVISDVRFANEAAAIRKQGGLLWRIERPGTHADPHPSEQGDFSYDALLANDGTLDSLYAQVDALFVGDCR